MHTVSASTVAYSWLSTTRMALYKIGLILVYEMEMKRVCGDFVEWSV